MTTLKEQADLRNRRGVFADRLDAGGRLAEMMTEYRGRGDAVVLAVPSGGVPVGLALARRLDLPLDVVIARKLQIPGNTEAGFGALALEGGRFLNEELVASLGLTPEQIDKETAVVQLELDKRNDSLRDGRPLPDMKGRTAILADDGLASGFTMYASVDAVRRKNPSRIVVAVPTAPISSIRRLDGLVDEVVCINVHEHRPFAVAAAYRSWRDLETSEVLAMLSG